MNIVKGIIFDYGGTIDTNGMHWAEVIWEQYQRVGIAVDKAEFREAYVHGERTLARFPIIDPSDTFRTLLHKKVSIHSAFLKGKINETQAVEIAEGCYEKVLATLRVTRGVVEKLSAHYPMVLVTNFYGNMPVVLREFALDRFFGTIVESSVVGLRKPDPALFAMGANSLALPAENILVVGDSYRKDILPAHTLGCSTAWIKGLCWEEETPLPDASPDVIIESLAELLPLLGVG